MKSFSVKVINKIVTSLTILFFVLASFSSVRVVSEYSQAMLRYEELMSSVTDFNDSNLINVSDEELTDEVGSEVEFSNATSAFLYAYDNVFNEMESYYIITSGTMTNVIDLKITSTTLVTESQKTMVKYKDGSMIFEVTSYEKENKYNSKVSTLLYYDSATNRLYHNKTSSVVKTSSALVAEYDPSDCIYAENGAQVFYDLFGIYPGKPIYQFSRGSITQENSFKKTTNGHNDIYIVDVTSNHKTVGKNYEKAVTFIIKAPYPTAMNYMYETAVINNRGTFDALMFENNFNASVKVSDMLILSGVCTEIEKYNFIELGGDISYVRPNISLATEHTIH
ncbi:MAG: hypothetical protein AB7S44_03785 [Spirochaetales bacterium]